MLERHRVGLPAVDPVFKKGSFRHELAENEMLSIKFLRGASAKYDHMLVQALVAQLFALGDKGGLVMTEQ